MKGSYRLNIESLYRGWPTCVRSFLSSSSMKCIRDSLQACKTAGIDRLKLNLWFFSIMNRPQCLSCRMMPGVVTTNDQIFRRSSIGSFGNRWNVDSRVFGDVISRAFADIISRVFSDVVSVAFGVMTSTMARGSPSDSISRMVSKVPVRSWPDGSPRTVSTTVPKW
jgi:hypothetical protein